MMKRSWLFVIALVASLAGLGVGPAQAASPSWIIQGITNVGCTNGDADLPVLFDTGGQDYFAHTKVTVNGLVYMNESAGSANGETSWSLFDTFNYGAVPNPGTWPMPAGQPVTIRVQLEKPKGTVLTSWTMVMQSCDRGAILYNGPTALDTDADYVATPTDKCPKLKAIGRADGCPLRARSLTLAAKTSPKRVTGRLYSAGFPTLYAGRPVVIWKIRSGPDLKIATLTSSSGGYFSATVGSGYYYATSSTYRSPSAGVAAADQSPNVHVP